MGVGANTRSRDSRAASHSVCLERGGVTRAAGTDPGGGRRGASRRGCQTKEFRLDPKVIGTQQLVLSKRMTSLKEGNSLKSLTGGLGKG